MDVFTSSTALAILAATDVVTSSMDFIKVTMDVFTSSVDLVMVVAMSRIAFAAGAGMAKQLRAFRGRRRLLSDQRASCHRVE
jgi:hypothetical protein